MKYVMFYFLVVAFFNLALANEATTKSNDLPEQGEASEHFETDSFAFKKEILLHDNEQSRDIPVAMYFSTESNNKAVAGVSKQPVVIISHGYGIKNTGYTFIANALAAQGYYVLSVQQDLDTDLDLPRSGNLYQKRMPFWERGVKNLKFVISTLRRTNSELDMDNVILIGHSNGGDISMMFSDQYPKQVKKVISLDSLRYSFPRNVNILSLRANDTVADRGVLANDTAKIINLNDTKHIDMCDQGVDKIKNKIVNNILKFLKED
jgi:peptidoglycan-N-acetylglucosamine deacetylase